jgi:hypothetical protein
VINLYNNELAFSGFLYTILIDPDTSTFDKTKYQAIRKECKMKKIALLALFVLMTFSMVACSKKLLQPNDTLGDMKLLSYCEGELVNKLCTPDELYEGTCVVPAGVTDLWVSAGWAEETTEELETAWKDSTWKMTFDGHPVDLSAFGTYDVEIDDPDYGLLKARVWNFCVSNPTPGKHNARYDSNLPNAYERGNHTEDWTFTVLEP